MKLAVLCLTEIPASVRARAIPQISSAISAGVCFSERKHRSMSLSWPMTAPERAAPSRVPKEIQPSSPQSSRMIARTRSAMAVIASTAPPSRRVSKIRWVSPHLSMMTGLPKRSTSSTRPLPEPKTISSRKISSSSTVMLTTEVPSRREPRRFGHGTLTGSGASSTATDQPRQPSKCTSSDPSNPRARWSPSSSTRSTRGTIATPPLLASAARPTWTGSRDTTAR